MLDALKTQRSSYLLTCQGHLLYLASLLSSIFTIFWPVLPSPNGFNQVFLWARLVLAASRILCGFVPASMFDPTSKVSGLSVLSRKVTQGMPRMQVSSCTPPESVKTSLALLSSCKKDK
jgi:hypothetical protein